MELINEKRDYYKPSTRTLITLAITYVEHTTQTSTVWRFFVQYGRCQEHGMAKTLAMIINSQSSLGTGCDVAARVVNWRWARRVGKQKTCPQTTTCQCYRGDELFLTLYNAVSHRLPIDRERLIILFSCTDQSSRGTINTFWSKSTVRFHDVYFYFFTKFVHFEDLECTQVSWQKRTLMEC